MRPHNREPLSSVMARQRGTQAQPQPTVVTGAGNASLTKALQHARQSGHLKVRGRGLQAFPIEACEIEAVVLPEGSAWWEAAGILETADISQNEIPSLPDAIVNLRELRELDATHNNLESLPAAEAWAGMEALVSLSVGHNRLRQLPEGLGRDNVPPLVRLNAAHNALGPSLPASLGGLADLVELDLSHNQLAALPRGLSGLHSLRKLWAQRNQLAGLPADLLAAPPPLVEFDLSENRLAELEAALPTVLTLLLANNQLRRLDLTGCAGLQELSAPFNQLVELPCAMPSLPRLATVDLGSNKLAAIEELVLCASLTRLDLSNNDIREVPPRIGNLKLSKLALAGNPLRTMPAHLLTAPTPKLLTHLRGKIVDAAPQWEGDVRGEMAVAGGRENQPYNQPLNGYGGYQYPAGEAAAAAAHNAPVVFGGRSAAAAQLPQEYQPQQHGHPNETPTSGRGFNALYNRTPRAPAAHDVVSARADALMAARARAGGGGGGAPQPPPAASASAAVNAPFQTSLQPQASAPPNALAHFIMKEGRELAVANSGLNELPPDGYPPTLTSIDASANKLAAVPEALHEMAPSLMRLNLARNALASLPTDLGECEQLQALLCPHNQIRELTFLDVVPDPLPSLVEVNFDRNALVEIPPALWTCARLKHVSLCANRLELASLHMPSRADGADGDGMPAPLEHLDLGENRLGALPPLALYPRLREVHVQQNGIRELPVAQLVPLRQLQTLDVSMNDVSQLPPHLSTLPVLQNLTIIGNPIRSIPQSVQQRGATAILDLLRKRMPAEQ